MNTNFIKGVVVPILTPIDENEQIDEKKMREQVDYVIDGGVQGILAFGSNGEFYAIEEDEMERGLKIMVHQGKGRVPVYFGIGGIPCCSFLEISFPVARAGQKAHAQYKSHPRWASASQVSVALDGASFHSHSRRN